MSRERSDDEVRLARSGRSPAMLTAVEHRVDREGDREGVARQGAKGKYFK
jgi:hypothetical protein